MKEGSGTFTLTTSSFNTDIMAVTRTLKWLDTQPFAHVYFPSDSMIMLRKSNGGWAHKQLLESLRTCRMIKMCFIFVPWHAGVRGKKELTGLLVWR